jgi:tripartite ATP-independent transporter DctP family solute receptor
MRSRTFRGSSRFRSSAAFGALLIAVGACGGAEDPDTASPDDAGQDNGAAPDGEASAAGAAECNAVAARASHHISAESAAHLGLENLAEGVADRTEGRVTIDVFSDAQLGGLAEMTDNLRSGAIELALIDSGTLSQFTAELGVFDLPFLFEDMAEFNELMDGPVGETVNETVVSEVDIEPLYWSAVGLRDMYFVGTEVRTPEDMQGLTMRVPEAPVWVDTFTALGTSPTAIPAGELYTSLQTGVVDGFEFPAGTAVDLNMYEPVETMSRTGHILTNILIAASPEFMDSLCDADREALAEAVVEAEEATRRLWEEDNANAAEVLEENLTIIEDIDLDAFRETTSVVHEDFIEANGSELYDQVEEQLGR